MFILKEMLLSNCKRTLESDQIFSCLTDALTLIQDFHRQYYQISFKSAAHFSAQSSKLNFWDE